MFARLTTLTIILTLFSSTQPLLPQSETKKEQPVPTTATLATPGMHRLYLLDPIWAGPGGNIQVVKGDTQEYLGTLDTGFLPHLALAPDYSELYVFETYWERGSRGKRTDVITFYDTTKLEPTGEVVLPKGRLLSGIKQFGAGITTDGRYLLSYNMQPASSVSLVDARNRKYLGDIWTPACALVFPFAADRFAMLCGDGSMLTVTIDENLENVKRVQTEPFFNPDEDPLMDHPFYDSENQLLYFVSYEGMVHAVDLSGDQPVFQKPWSLISPQFREWGWRAGGRQLFAGDPIAGRFYVLMHKGDKWTHKEMGTEVWAYDLAEQKHLARLKLEIPAESIFVAGAQKPLLYALNPDEDRIDIYDATHLEHLTEFEELGVYPVLIYSGGK